MDITVKDVINVCEGRLIYGDENKVCKSFEKDTRQIKNGDTFIGIKGESFDGNLMYKEAFEKGAQICILSGLDEYEYCEGKTLIEVKDSIKALQELAKYKRSLYNIPVVAVTGSVGKTSTKDIIASVMAQKYRVLKTEGNMNNHIGLPMTILKLDNHEAMVIEMGMNHFGEISVLTNIAKPTMAVISNIGSAHIGNLGSRENILKAKLEILEGMEENAPIIVNNDNDLLNDWNKNVQKTNKVITYGIENDSDIMARNIQSYPDGSEFILDFNNSEYRVHIPVGGNHFVYNALSAICVGIENKIEIKDIINGIEKFELTKRRMEVIKIPNGGTIINDTYNASYDSIKAALEYLHSISGNKKIAILGDILELGDYEQEMHEKVGEEVFKNKIDVLITVGKGASFIVKKVIELGGINNIKIYECKTNNEAIKFAKNEIGDGDIALIKASNSMHFDEIVKGLIE